MSLENYVAKIQLAISISRGFDFIKLLINSKKFSHAYESKFAVPSDEIAEVYKLKLNGHPCDLHLRTYNGDIGIFYEIFWKKMYDISTDILQNPKTIVDLGAHIGLVSIFYKTKFPSAKAYAIEGSKKNAELLRKNLSNFSSTHPFHNVIHSKDGYIHFLEDGLYSYNTKISETGEGEPTECICMNTFMRENNIDKIDLLKIDIEGAEKKILKENNEWLHHVDNIIIELHPPYTIIDLENDLKPFGFQIFNAKEENNLQNIFASKHLPNQ